MNRVDQLLQSATTHHQKGRFSDAERSYKEILKLDKNQTDVLRLLGTLYLQINQPTLAVTMLERGVGLLPQHPEMLNNLGAALFRLNRLKDAINSYHMALTVRPNYPEASNNLATAYLNDGQPLAAIKVLEVALAQKPNYAQSRYNLGCALSEVGRYEDAISQYCEALRLNPRYADAVYSLAMLYRKHDQRALALEVYAKAEPLDLNNFRLLNNFGNLLREDGRPEDAVPRYQRALELKPDYVEAHINLGTVLRDQGKLHESRQAYEKALKIDPKSAEAYINLGTLLQDLGEKDLALQHYETALKLQPQSVNAKWNIGLMRLARGDYAGAWHFHELGLGRPDMRGPVPFENKAWQGESLAGKRLLIWCEQGLGDSLQFIRYAELCHAQGATVSVLAPRALKKILATHPSVAYVLTEATEADFDYQVAMMSLPYFFKTTLETIPQKIPYLATPSQCHAKWFGRFKDVAEVKVGLVWAGNARESLVHAHIIDKRRSISLKDLSPLFEVPNVVFYSLQMGKPAEQIETFDRGAELRNSMGEVTDFTDTAAIIQNLDLVISVDTSVVHLAGAIGKPVWVLSRFDACWRWLGNQPESPWYPTARIFGQTEPGNWQSVILKVREALSNYVATTERKA